MYTHLGELNRISWKLVRGKKRGRQQKARWERLRRIWRRAASNINCASPSRPVALVPCDFGKGPALGAVALF
ncbi:unnamed protein product, partial [Iphiclides podalirius]